MDTIFFFSKFHPNSFKISMIFRSESLVLKFPLNQNFLEITPKQIDISRTGNFFMLFRFHSHRNWKFFGNFYKISPKISGNFSTFPSLVIMMNGLWRRYIADLTSNILMARNQNRKLLMVGLHHTPFSTMLFMKDK